MIDWLTLRIPVRLPHPIHGGHMVKLDRLGNVCATVPHRLKVEGSFSSSLAVRAPSTSELELSGNVVKWLQGHNLYGTSDPIALVWAALQRLEKLDDVLPCSLADMGLSSPADLAPSLVTRIDCTAMLLLDTPGDVLAWIRSAHDTGTLSHRGRGVMREGTLVYGDAKGRSFTRSQIVMYHKGTEIGVHPLPDFMMQDAEVLGWAGRCLRAEVRLGRLELAKRELRLLGAWKSDTAAKMWDEKMSLLNFNDCGNIGPAKIAELPTHLRTTYAAWTTGEDVRNMLARRTFYRYRRQLQELAGVDIAIPPPKVPTAQIVPIKRVLEAVPAGRPGWADRIDRQLRDAGAVVLHAA